MADRTTLRYPPQLEEVLITEVQSCHGSDDRPHFKFSNDEHHFLTFLPSDSSIVSSSSIIHDLM